MQPSQESNMSALKNISPIDGRYQSKTVELNDFFSEFALIRYRVMVEVEYFIALCELPLPQLKGFEGDYEDLRAIYEEFQTEDAEEIKEIEKTTNHDVKAVEYYLKRQFDEMGLEQWKEFLHFGLTSQDINNTSLWASIMESGTAVLLMSWEVRPKCRNSFHCSSPISSNWRLR